MEEVSVKVELRLQYHFENDAISTSEMQSVLNQYLL